MSVHSQVACPDCGSPIFIESSLLLTGQSFKCSNEKCSVALSLDMSETDKVSKAYDEFENIRDQARSQASTGG